MLVIKGRSKYRVVLWVEKTYIRNTEATLRCLLYNQARFGCVSLYPVAASEAAESAAVGVRGAGVRLTPRSKAPVRGVTIEAGEVLAKLVLHISGVQEAVGQPLLQQVHLWIYAGVAMQGCKFDSKQTSHRSVNSRSYQNGFVCLPARDVISVCLGVDGCVQPCRSDIVAGSVYAQIQCFFQTSAAVVGDVGGQAVLAAAGQPDSMLQAGPYALVQVLNGAKQEIFAGSRTIVTREPCTDVSFTDLFVVPVRAFKAQLLLLKGRHDRSNLRFLQCPGKLYMV